MFTRHLGIPIRRVAIIALLATVGVHAAAQTGAGKIIQPNSHLTVEGIPPISEELARRVARYNDFRPRRLVDWHPVKREMLVATRTSGVTVQLHLLRKRMGELEQLTDFPDPVRDATFEPKQGRYIVFEKDE